MSAAPISANNERDAGVVEEICGYLTEDPPRSYFLFAGAGSGKTRTLVEVLRRMTGVVQHEKGGQRWLTSEMAKGEAVATGNARRRLAPNRLCLAACAA